MSGRLQIGILGSGPAGRTLGAGFLGRGHQVMIGSRDPAKLQGWLDSAGPAARAGTFADVARLVYSHRAGKTHHAFKLVGK